MLLERAIDGTFSFAFTPEESRVLDLLHDQSEKASFDDQPDEFKTVVLMGNSIFMVATHELNLLPIPSFKPYALISLYIYNEMYDRAKRTAMLMCKSVAFHTDPIWRLKYKKGKVNEFNKIVKDVCRSVKKGIKKYGKEEYFKHYYME